MKKKYIKPNVSVSFVVVESLLQAASKGSIYTDQNDDGGGAAKKHDFMDDSFDNIAWPKSKSPWED